MRWPLVRRATCRQETADDELARPLEAAQRLKTGLTAGPVDWGWVLASASMIAAYYCDRDPLPAETGPLELAILALLAGTAADSGLEPETRKQWALEALVFGGMLKERPVIAQTNLPDLAHPAFVAAAGLSSSDWLDTATTGSYQEVLEEAGKLVAVATDASPARARAAYTDAMRAVLGDPEATAYEIATLGYARGSLTRLVMDFETRR